MTDIAVPDEKGNWWHSSAVERQSLTGSWWWPFIWVNRPLYSVGQPTMANSAFHPFEVDKWVVSCNQMVAITTHSSGVLWWMLRGEGRCGVFAGKTVWSTPERLNWACPYCPTRLNSTEPRNFKSWPSFSIYFRAQ